MGTCISSQPTKSCYIIQSPQTPKQVANISELPPLKLSSPRPNRILNNEESTLTYSGILDSQKTTQDIAPFSLTSEGGKRFSKSVNKSFKIKTFSKNGSNNIEQNISLKYRNQSSSPRHHVNNFSKKIKSKKSKIPRISFFRNGVDIQKPFIINSNRQIRMTRTPILMYTHSSFRILNHHNTLMEHHHTRLSNPRCNYLSATKINRSK